jgi:hypothetical protein
MPVAGEPEEGSVDWLLLQLEISVTNGRFAPL